jgi:hypothetical protein
VVVVDKNSKEKGRLDTIKNKKKEHWNESFRAIFVEVVSIVLGVLLALAVNEWRAQRIHDSEAESALQNIKNEVISNQKTLDAIHANNLTTVELMKEKSGGGEDRKFIPGMQLKSSAWQTLLSTGTSNYVDYETILVLSDTYSLQEIYTKTGQMLTESAMNMSAYAVAQGTDIDNDRFSKQFSDYMNMIVQVEEELLKSYRKSIERLEPSNKQ